MGTVSYLPNITSQRLRVPIARPIAKLAARQEPQPCTKGVEIGPLIFRCPMMGHSFESGIEVDSLTFQRIGHLSVHLHCPACHRPHELKVANGRLGSYGMLPSVAGLEPNWQPR